MPGGPAPQTRLAGRIASSTRKGGRAADHFSFVNLADSVVGANRDVILDFNHTQHDKIDLSFIDANNADGIDQSFQFIGAARFHQQAGELRYARHILQGDVDGDGTADFQIHVNAATLVRGDFVL